MLKKWDAILRDESSNGGGSVGPDKKCSPFLAYQNSKSR